MGGNQTPRRTLAERANASRFGPCCEAAMRINVTKWRGLVHIKFVCLPVVCLFQSKRHVKQTLNSEARLHMFGGSKTRQQEHEHIWLAIESTNSKSYYFHSKVSVWDLNLLTYSFIIILINFQWHIHIHTHIHSGMHTAICRQCYYTNVFIAFLSFIYIFFISFILFTLAIVVISIMLSGSHLMRLINVAFFWVCETWRKLN